MNILSMIPGVIVIGLLFICAVSCFFAFRHLQQMKKSDELSYLFSVLCKNGDRKISNVADSFTLINGLSEQEMAELFNNWKEEV